MVDTEFPSECTGRAAGASCLQLAARLYVHVGTGSLVLHKPDGIQQTHTPGL